MHRDFDLRGLLYAMVLLAATYPKCAVRWLCSDNPTCAKVRSVGCNEYSQWDHRVELLNRSVLKVVSGQVIKLFIHVVVIIDDVISVLLGG